MAKVVLITDQHFGVRNDNQMFAEHMERFYSEVFFPYIDKHNIKEIVMLGDVFDRRKYSNHVTLYNAKRMYFEELNNRKILTHVIIGNHDTAYKTTNAVNTPELVLAEYPTIHCYSKPTEIMLGKTKVVLMPWMCPENYQESVELMAASTAQVLMGHLEIAGFEMYRGSPSDHGYGRELFDKFDLVMSGHFHHKSTSGNINYLGAPYEMTWSDFDDPRGFHIFDTDTRELEYIQNPLHMFHKLVYNDAGKTIETLVEDVFKDVSPDDLKNCYVKVVVQEKQNPYWFDLLVDKLEKAGIGDLKVVDDHLSLGFDDADDLINEAEDTPTIIKKFATSFFADKDEAMLKELNTLLLSLYNESLSMDTASQ